MATGAVHIFFRQPSSASCKKSADRSDSLRAVRHLVCEKANALLTTLGLGGGASDAVWAKSNVAQQSQAVWDCQGLLIGKRLTGCSFFSKERFCPISSNCFALWVVFVYSCYTIICISHCDHTSHEAYHNGGRNLEDPAKFYLVVLGSYGIARGNLARILVALGTLHSRPHIHCNEILDRA